MFLFLSRHIPRHGADDADWCACAYANSVEVAARAQVLTRSGLHYDIRVIPLDDVLALPYSGTRCPPRVTSSRWTFAQVPEEWRVEARGDKWLELDKPLDGEDSRDRVLVFTANEPGAEGGGE